MTRKDRLGGLYLVVDAGAPRDELLARLRSALAGGVDLVQLWGGGAGGPAALETARGVLASCRNYGVPLIVADDVELCVALEADGVHLDGYDLPRQEPPQIRERLGAGAIVGVTCGASEEKLRWAAKAEVDYISFCSMFPTSSVESCDIVPLGMIARAKALLDVPVFASGGMTVTNSGEVMGAGADGIAVISAVMKAEDPAEVAREFKGAMARFLVQQD